jgi:hypothetical protein
METTRVELEDALNNLQQAIHVPVVSGELIDWLQLSVDGLKRVNILVEREVGASHRELFAQIIEDDPELSQQVEKLQDEDHAILEQANGLTAMGHKLQQIGDGIEPHESQLAPAVDRFVHDCEGLFMRIRKQEVAISTWLQEALERDRGTGD